MQREKRVMIEWECQQLLNKVVTYTDSHCWQTLADCYTEEAVLFRPSDPDKGIVGKKDIYASFIARPPRATCHMLANCVFEVVSETSVKATSRVWLIAGDVAEKLPVEADKRILIGSFADELVYQNGCWLIAQRKGGIELKHTA